jgi:hypothetical protein
VRLAGALLVVLQGVPDGTVQQSGSCWEYPAVDMNESIRLAIMIVFLITVYPSTIISNNNFF